jgi:hypothetical protein
VDLDASSRTAAGQTITFPTRRFSTLQIKITDVSDPRRKLLSGADAVGFAEIRLRDAHADHDVRVDEVERMPSDLLDALGARSSAHALVLVMARDALRPVPPRTDPELSITRTFTLPTARAFALTGGASVNPGASDAAIDASLGLPTAVTAEASESMPGCLQCRAASAADGNPATAWNTPFVGVGGQWVQLTANKPVTFSTMNLQVVADGRHSLPTRIELQVDGAVREIALPPITNGTTENATQTIPLQFPAMTGRRVRVTITGVQVQRATRESTGDTVTAPIGLAELGIPGLRVGHAPATVPGVCRSDLLTVDGHAVPVRVGGPQSATATLGSLPVSACDPRHPSATPAISLSSGAHVLRTSEGVRTGMQLDRVVLASDATGAPLAVADGRVTGLGTTAPPAPTVTMVHNGPTRMRVHVSGADDPFWLVLGQSQSNGWQATAAKLGSLGPSHLVDGYANGWLVRPVQGSFDVVLQWTPQRKVWAAIWISLAAALGCIAIIGWAFVRRRVRARAPAPVDPDDSDVWLEWPLTPRGAATPRRGRVALPLLLGLAAALVVAPWAGVVVLVLVAAIAWRPRLRTVLVLTPAVCLVLVTAYVLYLQHHLRFPPVFEWPTLFPLARPLAWMAVVFLGVDVVLEHVWYPIHRRRSGAAPPIEPQSA